MNLTYWQGAGYEGMPAWYALGLYEWKGGDCVGKQSDNDVS